MIKHARHTRDLIVSVTLHSIEAKLAQDKINPPFLTKALQPLHFKIRGRSCSQTHHW